MSLLSTKILLYIVLCSTICQHTRSQYLVVPENSGVLIYENSSHTIVFEANKHDEDSDRIAGGRYATLGQFPYMAVVHRLVGNGIVGQCGGTVLSRRWVLTAGHCVVKYPRRFFVVFGIVDKSGIGYDFLQGPGVPMITNQAFIHPLYAQSHNDIGLLYMPQDIPFSNTIQPVKLLYYDESFVNKDAYVIGWGKDYMGSRGTTGLKYATLPIIENYVCKQYWHISNKHICTVAKSKQDACQGDSGGPLIVVQNGQHFQIGIVSYGDAFCPSKLPGVFTRVSSFTDWICEITKNKLREWGAKSDGFSCLPTAS